jgi:hypothetical protein
VSDAALPLLTQSGPAIGGYADLWSRGQGRQCQTKITNRSVVAACAGEVPSLREA